LAVGTEKSQGVEELQGTWMLVAGEVDGKALAADELHGAKLTIDGDRYTVTLADRGTVRGIERLDPTSEPKTIDVTDDNGPNQGRTCLGIYEVNGDEFRVAFAMPGKPRPTSFQTVADSGQWTHVWVRVKP
jgi:uncharacterized protein (TIGR03067 family)